MGAWRAWGQDAGVILAAAILFTLAALGGVGLASMHFAGKHVPLWMGMLHAGLALPGLVLLFWGTGVRNWPPLLTASLVLFMAAAGGGVVMFLTHGRNKPLPKPLIIGHGSLAVLGYVGLLIALFV